MLRSTVRLSRQVHRDGCTDRYGVTLTGEIPFPPDDAEGVLEKVEELFHLAEEALAREIEKGHDSLPPKPNAAEPTRPARPSASPRESGPSKSSAPRSESATPKQVQYLLSLGKRKGLSREDLDAIIAQVIGSPKKTGDLTKREAGQIIDHLTNLEPEANQ